MAQGLASGETLLEAQPEAPPRIVEVLGVGRENKRPGNGVVECYGYPALGMSDQIERSRPGSHGS